MSTQKPVAGFTPGTKGAKAFGCVVGILVAVIAVVLAVGIWASVTSSAPAPAKNASALVAPEVIARVSAEQAVRGVMNDPASYSYVRHTVRTVEVAEGVTGYRVELAFRGRNAFGGMVVNTAVVTTDDTGLHVLSIE